MQCTCWTTQCQRQQHNTTKQSPCLTVGNIDMFCEYSFAFCEHIDELICLYIKFFQKEFDIFSCKCLYVKSGVTLRTYSEVLDPCFFVSEGQVESVCQQIKVSSLQKESVTAVFKFSLAVTSTVVGQTGIVLIASHLSWKEASRPLEMDLQLWDCLAVDMQVPLAWSHKLLTLSRAFL